MVLKARWLKEPKGFDIRFTTQEDGKYIDLWLQDPQVKEWFPVETQEEIDMTIKTWTEYAKYGCSLTATMDGQVAGLAILYLQPFKRLAHQCLFAVIVDEKYRGQGVGTKLLNQLFSMAKKRFGIQWIHLEVYHTNPAIHLYEKLGFKQYGIRPKFLKNKTQYFDQILMQKKL